MKKIVAFMVVFMFTFGVAALAAADNKPLLAGEKVVHKDLINAVPADRMINVFQLHDVWKKAMADPAFRSRIYLLDVRTHPEFYAFHIEGSDHVSMTHVYALPKKIKDPNATIYVFCRTSHRSTYVAGLFINTGTRMSIASFPRPKTARSTMAAWWDGPRPGFPWSMNSAASSRSSGIISF